MRKFQVRTPDGRVIFHEAENVQAVRDTLIEGYAVEGEDLGNGFVISPPLPDVLPRHTLMTWLLREHSDELAEFVDGRIKDFEQRSKRGSSQK